MHFGLLDEVTVEAHALVLLEKAECGAGTGTGSQTGCWIRRNYFLNPLSANTEYLYISEVVPEVSRALGTTSRLVLCPILTTEKEHNDREEVEDERGVGRGSGADGGRAGGAGGGRRGGARRRRGRRRRGKREGVRSCRGGGGRRGRERGGGEGGRGKKTKKRRRRKNRMRFR